MIAKISHGSSLYGVLAYNQLKVDERHADVLFTSRIIEPQGDNPYTIGHLSRSFGDYLVANRKTEKPVLHISLNPDPKDCLSEERFVSLAEEYMRRMGITNTQYIVCRHTDREHQHLHIVANRVDNDGNTISDSNDNLRNVKVCKALTREYGLHFSKGKMNVKRDRLRGKDKVKYQIYDAIKAALPCCNCWSDLCDRLAKQGIGVNFKYNRNEGKIIGVSFTCLLYTSPSPRD
mgnify:CR=1 FL=1